MAATITKAEVRKVISLRKKGTKWEDITEQMGKTRSFIMKVRPLLREVDPSLISATGQAAPKYGAAKKSASKPRGTTMGALIRSERAQRGAVSRRRNKVHK